MCKKSEYFAGINFMAGERINGKKFISKVIGINDISETLSEIYEGKTLK